MEQQPEVHTKEPEVKREVEVHIRTKRFIGDLEVSGCITIQDVESRDFILLSAKIEEVDDLINLIKLLLEERVRQHGDASTRK